MKVEVAVLGSPSLIVLKCGHCGRKATLNFKLFQSELRSRVKMEVVVLGFLSLTVLVVSVDAKKHCTRAQELCESRGGRPGLPVPNSPYGLCGHKATVNLKLFRSELRSCVKVPNSPS